MKLAYITPGAAGMYCGSCLNDNALASALIRLGQDVALVPIYTPIRTDDEDVSIDRIFYGAINVYLEQRSALFRQRMHEATFAMARSAHSIAPPNQAEFSLNLHPVMVGSASTQAIKAPPKVAELPEKVQSSIIGAARRTAHIAPPIISAWLLAKVQ